MIQSIFTRGRDVIDTTKRIGAFSAWRPRQRSFFKELLFGWLRPDPQVAEITLSDTAIAVQYSFESDPLTVSLEAPFILNLSRWSYMSGHSELNISLRARDDARRGESAGVNFRVLWPSSAIEGWAEKRELFPFIPPQHLPAIWEALVRHAKMHGKKPTERVDTGIANARLEDLESEGEPPMCDACDSTVLKHFGRDQYLCRACNHKGGRGWYAIARREKTQRAANMSEADRRSMALGDLFEAQDKLAELANRKTFKRLDPFDELRALIEDVIALDPDRTQPLHDALDYLAHLNLASWTSYSDATQVRLKLVAGKLEEAERQLGSR